MQLIIKKLFTKIVSQVLKMKFSNISCLMKYLVKVSKGAKIRNRYNQEPHLTQDTNWKVTNSQLDTTNESEEVNPFTGKVKSVFNMRIYK